MNESRLTHKQALEKIKKISQKSSSVEQTKKDLFNVLNASNKEDYSEIVRGVVDLYNNSEKYPEKAKLQQIAAFVGSYGETKKKKTANKSDESLNPGVVKLVREKDSTGKYKVYSYLVKKWGYPKHIINEYVKQKKGSSEGIKITNSRGVEYKKDKKFLAGDTVYLKVPITSTEKIDGEIKEKIKIQENYMNEQISSNVVGVKITDSEGEEYPKNKKFLTGDTVYIKLNIGFNKTKKNKYKIKKGGTVKDIINEFMVEYKEKQKSYKEMLENFYQQHPMGKDIELSFGIPVWHYEDIEKTLASITTNQKIDPKRYEVVFLLNRPNSSVDFDKTVKDKILKFKQKHPEYNIYTFEKTFNFKKNKKGKWVVNYGELHKTLADTIVYRNIQRKNIKGMDTKKIKNLIIKTGAADSTDKNPRYIENQFKKYSADYSGKELVSMRGESRLPVNICKTYPLIEVLEFFQRNFDNEYAGGAINRNVGIGSYKSWIYCDAGGFNTDFSQGEDVQLGKDIKASIRNKNSSTTTMHYDSEFIGAVDESCDRGIWAMVENNQSYYERYNDETGNTASKEKNWNKYAIEHKGEEKFKVLELTRQNLEKNLSSFYRQRLNNIFIGKTSSRKYSKYLKGDGKKASPQEKAERIAKNVVNPIMESILLKDNLMGLRKSDYSFGPIKIEKYRDKKGEIKYRLKSAEIRFNENAISKIKAIQAKKIKDGYYNYR